MYKKTVVSYRFLFRHWFDYTRFSIFPLSSLFFHSLPGKIRGFSQKKRVKSELWKWFPLPFFIHSFSCLICIERLLFVRHCVRLWDYKDERIRPWGLWLSWESLWKWMRVGYCVCYTKAAMEWGTGTCEVVTYWIKAGPCVWGHGQMNWRHKVKLVT